MKKNKKNNTYKVNPIVKEIYDEHKKSHIKHCIHPDKKNCSDKIIKAHSIQNNKILSKLSKNGLVMMISPSFDEIHFDVDMKEIGRSIATTFTGFCGFHDKTTFQDIEDKDYTKEIKQNFLYAYRAFAIEYHKKMEQINLFKNTKKGKSNPILKMVMMGCRLAEKDLLFYKQKFDKAILKNDFDIFDTVVLEFNKEAKIAVCSGIFLEYDLKNKRLNDLGSLNGERMKMITLNIFPQNGKTYALLSWLKEDSSFYSEFKTQLVSLNEKKQLRCLNNLIPYYCENVAICPDLWDTFNNRKKKYFNKLFLAEFKSNRENSKKNLLKWNKINFFK